MVDKSSLADTYELKTGHLTQSQCEFFKKWEKLISLEERDLVRFRKELWTMGAADRERLGRCFSDMRLDDTFKARKLKDGGREEKIHRFTYRFLRDNGPSLLNGHMCVGDAITVSAEPDLLALARGFILELSPSSVVLGVDHEVSVGIIATRLSGRWNGAGPYFNSVRDVKELNLVYRIDKDELFGGMGRIRDNLARLFYSDGDTKRLQLIVDLRKPRFVPQETIRPPPVLPETLNLNQRIAIMKVLTAEDYALILGMPGTGKTMVVATLIRTLIGMGKSVLLTSHTHSAVDTILAKLGNEEFKILRLGNVDKVLVLL